MPRARSLTLLVLLAAAQAPAAEPPRVRDLRTQRAHGTTYFIVRVTPPEGLSLPDLDGPNGEAGEAQRFRLARLPRLVPQDRQTAAVYPCVELSKGAEGGDGLRFIGKVRGKGPAKLLLVYPTEKAGADKGTSPAALLARYTWAEAPLTLDFRDATRLPPYREERRAWAVPDEDDLEGRWAAAQARHLGVLEVQARDSSFYSLARTLTGRKYRVPAAPLAGPNAPTAEEAHKRLYETTTGAAALTESLATRRLLNSRRAERQDRTVDVERVRGITVGEHPWEEMMAGKKPDPEPLARLVPHDHYYLTFKSFRALTEFGEMLDEWGSNLLGAYEVTSRDYRVRQRYEKQLCLRSTALGKKLGPVLIRSVAVTGSDPYIREGSDVTLIFHVTNPALFLTAVEPFVQEARDQYGKGLRQGRRKYRGVTVESFVTPLREVSLHRAVAGEFVIYSNSAVALERVLDTHTGRRKALADSLDFQYMRTVFRRGDKDEDGFAFLSDAFIRTLVGPASKIKEKRRLEAMTSLTMVTGGALFAAWETGEPPRDLKSLLEASGLREEDIDVPDGKRIVWEGARQAAVSDVYNTARFLTPLVELPIDRVTAQERREYQAFRDEYMSLWRRYFDPVGLRFSLGDRQVRVQAYILPLIRSSQYNELRRVTGNGTTDFDPARLPPDTLMQFLVHLAGGESSPVVSDWMVFRLDDSPAFRKRLGLEIRAALDPKAALATKYGEMFWQLPVTFGIGVKDGQEMRRGMQKLWEQSNLGRGKLRVRRYRGVEITRARVNAERYRELARFIVPWLREQSSFGPLFTYLPTEEAPKAFYTAVIDGGYYISLGEEPLKRLIDQARARKAGEKEKSAGVPLNTSLYLAPSVPKAHEALGLYLEWESFRRSLANDPLWYALHRGGVLADDAGKETREAVALYYLGFVPVSPDGAAYRYDPRTDEVSDARHGSYHRPRLHAGLDEKSPLGRLLDQLRTVRADLRFREDGVHTSVTIERKAAGK